jgi:hypothetical protein
MWPGWDKEIQIYTTTNLNKKIYSIFYPTTITVLYIFVNTFVMY